MKGLKRKWTWSCQMSVFSLCRTYRTHIECLAWGELHSIPPSKKGKKRTIRRVWCRIDQPSVTLKASQSEPVCNSWRLPISTEGWNGDSGMVVGVGVGVDTWRVTKPCCGQQRYAVERSPDQKPVGTSFPTSKKRKKNPSFDCFFFFFMNDHTFPRNSPTHTLFPPPPLLQSIFQDKMWSFLQEIQQVRRCSKFCPDW